MDIWRRTFLFSLARYAAGQLASRTQLENMLSCAVLQGRDATSLFDGDETLHFKVLDTLRRQVLGPRFHVWR
jgi:hypothetical protein